MNVSREVQTLIDLGLTDLQARVYFSLYQKGPSEASTISKITNVARSDIYRTMDRLQQIGLIEKEISYPIRFKAFPLEMVFAILMKRQAKKYKELKSEINFLLLKSKKKNNSENSLHEESKFVLIPSREALIKKLKDAIKKTQISIDLTTTVRRFKFACYTFADPLEKAWSRGVNGRAIIVKPEEAVSETLTTTWKKPSAEIRYVSIIPKIVMVMYDKKEVLIYTDPTADLDKSPALWSNDRSLLAMAEFFFEALWKRADRTR